MRLAMLVVGVAVSVSLAGCVPGEGRMMSYGARLADAKVAVDGHHYSVWLHGHDNTLLVQRGFSEGMVLGVKEGFEHRDTMDVTAYWRAAAQALLGPAGCKVTKIDPLDFHTTWEAAYACAPGSDLHAFVQDHRAALRAGLVTHIAS